MNILPVIEGYNFTVNLEDRGMVQKMQQIKSEARSLKTVMRASFAELNDGEHSFQAYTERIKLAQAAISKYTEAIATLRKENTAYEASEKAGTLEEKDRQKWLRNIRTISSFRNQLASLRSQVESSNMALQRLSTGIDSYRKATESITKITATYSRSLRENGQYYKSNRAAVEGAKDQSKALTNQLKAEIAVSNQLRTRQQGLQNSASAYAKALSAAREQVTLLTSKQKSLKDAIGNAETRLKASKIEFGENSKQAQKASQKLEQLKKDYDATSKSLKANKEVISESDSKLSHFSEAIGKNSTKLANQAEQARKTAAQLKNVNKSLQGISSTRLGSAYKAASQRLTTFNNKLKESTSNTRKWWQESKSSFAGISVALGAVGAGMVKATTDAAQVQKQYIEVRNLLRTSNEGVSESIQRSNKMMQDGVKYSQEYGYSQEEIGKQYEELVRRGYSGTQALGSMNSMLKAARASGDDYADVVKVTSSAVDAFGLRVDKGANQVERMSRNTARVANAMASAADRTASGFHDMGIGMSYAASTAKTVGWSIEQTSAALGELSNRGIEGSTAKLIVILYLYYYTGLIIRNNYLLFCEFGEN